MPKVNCVSVLVEVLSRGLVICPNKLCSSYLYMGYMGLPIHGYHGVHPEFRRAQYETLERRRNLLRGQDGANIFWKIKDF